MRAQIRTAIIAYLSDRADVPGATEDERDRYNYVASGHLDSFGIVEFVTELEDRFKFRFTSEDLSSAEFQTIGGLVELMCRRIPSSGRSGS